MRSQDPDYTVLREAFSFLCFEHFLLFIVKCIVSALVLCQPLMRRWCWKLQFQISINLIPCLYCLCLSTWYPHLPVSRWAQSGSHSLLMGINKLQKHHIAIQLPPTGRLCENIWCFSHKCLFSSWPSELFISNYHFYCSCWSSLSQSLLSFLPAVQSFCSTL